MKFSDLNIHEQLKEAITYRLRASHSIQEKAIPIILEHKDLIACAQAGAGRTGTHLFCQF